MSSSSTEPGCPKCARWPDAEALHTKACNERDEARAECAQLKAEVERLKYSVECWSRTLKSAHWERDVARKDYSEQLAECRQLKQELATVQNRTLEQVVRVLDQAGHSEAAARVQAMLDVAFV